MRSLRILVGFPLLALACGSESSGGSTGTGGVGAAANTGAQGAGAATGGAGVTGAGGTTGARACPAGQTQCGTECVDVLSNSSHCGACNMAVKQFIKIKGFMNIFINVTINII